MTIDAGVVLTGSLAVVGGIVWLVRLEGRIALTDARYVDLKGDLNEIKHDLKTLTAKSLARREQDSR